MVSQDIPESTNVKVLIASLTISTIFVLLRTLARIYKTRTFPYAPEDLAIYLALTFFAIMTSLYLSILPVLTRAIAIQSGLAPPYATMMADIKTMLKEFFAVQIFFWGTLWAVKFSLLLMFQKLTKGLPTYERVWWGVVGFTGLSFVGCLVSQFTSCSSMHAWFNVGLCSTPQDAVAKAASLWYSLAVDLITDLMIMAVPIRVLYDLQISTAQKLSVGLVFIVGIITMIFAIVRVVSLDSGTSHGQVNSSWLILWAAIEGAVAIIVGCLPSFAIFIRGRVEASRSNPTYPTTSTSYTNNTTPQSLSHSRLKSKARIESLALDDLEHHHHRDHDSRGSPYTPPHHGSFGFDARTNDGGVESRGSGSEAELVGAGVGVGVGFGGGEREKGDGRGLGSGADGRGSGITVTQNWSQKWHLGGPGDEEREKARRLGLGRVV